MPRSYAVVLFHLLSFHRVLQSPASSLSRDRTSNKSSTHRLSTLGFPSTSTGGGTHLHTTCSPDAGMVGNLNLGTGHALCFAHWCDPGFDPADYAFYYVWVIEIPTPRWTAFDTRIFGIGMGEDTVLKLQARAYTSPIW